MTDRAELPESALDRARREAHEAICENPDRTIWPTPHVGFAENVCIEGHEAIARLEAAAREEGYERGCRETEACYKRDEPPCPRHGGANCDC